MYEVVRKGDACLFFLLEEFFYWVGVRAARFRERVSRLRRTFHRPRSCNAAVRVSTFTTRGRPSSLFANTRGFFFHPLTPRKPSEFNYLGDAKTMPMPFSFLANVVTAFGCFARVVRFVVSRTHNIAHDTRKSQNERNQSELIFFFLIKRRTISE